MKTEKQIKRRKEYLRDREKRLEYAKEYREKNKGKLVYNKTYMKEYRIKNKEHIKNLKSDYYDKNKDKYKLTKEQKLVINERNRTDEYRINRNKKLKEKRKTDKFFCLRKNIGTSISRALRKNGHKQKNTLKNILGCDFEFLEFYIELQFEHWMNWSNYGKYNGELNYGWDLDHKIPINSVTKEDDIYRINHFSNLQPLCSYINRIDKK